MSSMLRGHNARHTASTGRPQHTLGDYMRSSHTPFLSVHTSFSMPAEDQTGLATLAGPFPQHLAPSLSPYDSFHSITSTDSRSQNDIPQHHTFTYGSPELQGAMDYSEYSQAAGNTYSVPFLSASRTSPNPSPTSPGGYRRGPHLVLRCKWEGCDYTGGFRRTHYLKRHVLTQHIEPRSHECPEYGCGMSFNRRDNLRWHLRRVHPHHPANS